MTGTLEKVCKPRRLCKLGLVQNKCQSGREAGASSLLHVYHSRGKKIIAVNRKRALYLFAGLRGLKVIVYCLR